MEENRERDKKKGIKTEQEENNKRKELGKLDGRKSILAEGE